MRPNWVKVAAEGLRPETGPAVKDAGFPVLLTVLAGVAFCGFLALSMLPSERTVHAATAPKPAE